MWIKYEAGCPNVFLCTDSKLNEVLLKKSLAVWRTANPNCLLTPVYIKSRIRNVDFDYIIFFHETGAAGGYFGGEWHSVRGDGHFPVFLNAFAWFPVRKLYNYQIYNQKATSSGSLTTGGYENYINSYEASRQVDDERFLKIVPEETMERNVEGDDQTFVGVAPAPPGLLAAASASSEQRSEAPSVAPMRDPAPDPTRIAAAGPSQAGSSSGARVEPDMAELMRQCLRECQRVKNRQALVSVPVDEFTPDLDCVAFAAARAKEDSETKKIADDTGLDPDVITNQGMIETQRGLGKFGGGVALLLPFSGSSFPFQYRGGGIDPADLLEDGIVPATLEERASFDEQEEAATLAEEDIEAGLEERVYNAFRVFNQEITTPILFFRGFIIADPFRQRYNAIEWECVYFARHTTQPTIEEFVLWFCTNSSLGKHQFTLMLPLGPPL